MAGDGDRRRGCGRLRGGAGRVCSGIGTPGRGFAYGLDENLLTCMDFATGERRWRGGRYGFGQVILAGDLLLVQTEPGDVALVEATPAEHRELARLPALQQRTWNHPALADNILLVRNDREAACYQLDTR